MMLRFSLLLIWLTVSANAASLVIRDAKNQTISVVPSGGITTISDAGAVALRGDFTLTFRLQTHNGNKIPLGLYTDSGMTAPAVEEGAAIIRWRDEITTSGIVASGTGTLHYVDGIPCIRNALFTIPSQLWFPSKRGALYLAARKGPGEDGIFMVGSGDQVLWYSNRGGRGAPGASLFAAFYDGSFIYTDRCDFGWEHRAAVRTGDTAWQLWRQGILEDTTAATNVQPTSNPANITISGDLVAVGYSTTGALSADADAYFGALCPVNPSWDRFVTCVGDSITQGVGGVTQPYPYQLELLLPPSMGVRNSGIASRTIATMLTDAALEIDGAWPESAGQKVLLVFAGTNDLFFGASAATAYADLVTYCQARQALGDKVVVFTPLPRTGVGTPGGFEAARLTFKSSITTNWPTFADAYVEADLAPLDDSTNVTYFADLTHPTNAGNTVLAARAKAGIDRIPFEGRTSGAGSPEGLVKALVGTCYERTDGGAGTSLYIKESGSGITGWTAVSSATLGTGVATFLGTPSSANLRAALTDESGTGALLFAGGALGAATATSINGNFFTAGSSTYTGTAGQTYTFPTTTATIARTDAAQTFAGTQTFSAGNSIAATRIDNGIYYSTPSSQLEIGASTFRTRATGRYGWTADTTGYNAYDTSLSRDSAGVIDFDGSSAGDKAGSWKATNGTLSGTLAVTGASALTGGIVGTTAGGNATAGNVGEYVSASVVQGSATALTTATAKTVTSISLTAGDWDITAIGALTGASTGTVFDVAIGTTTNSFTGTALGDTRAETPTVSLTGADATLMIPAARVTISGTTTYYLILSETFTIGSPSGYGRISARRVR